jgi:peptide/nickel transport system ATP-binding protein
MTAGTEQPLLEVQDLSVQFERPLRISGAVRGEEAIRVKAVDHVSFSVRRGEMLALVGESGSGKTTTVQAIVRLLDPQGGSIRLAGDEITSLSNRALKSVRRRIQLVFQDPYESLDPRFRVRRTVSEPLRVHHIGKSEEERIDLVRSALRRVELEPPDLLMNRYPHELSGGQRQRVALAAALVLEPHLLIADEPVSMLDVSVRAGVLELLAELRRGGMGILMITHDLSTAAKFADRIAVMYLGRIVEEGTTREVIENPVHPYTRALLSVVPPRDPRVKAHPEILRGEIPDPTQMPSGCHFHPRCPVVFDRCSSEDPMLRHSGTSDHQAACLRVGRQDAAGL